MDRGEQDTKKQQKMLVWFAHRHRKSSLLVVSSTWKAVKTAASRLSRLSEVVLFITLLLIRLLRHRVKHAASSELRHASEV